jgi:hypothetical protein
MTAVEVGDRYIVIGCNVVTARICEIRLISRKLECSSWNQSGSV